MALLAEEAGLDSVWLGEHLLYRDGHGVEGAQGPWEAWAMLAALAAVTTRVELGPLVAALPFHNPAMFAKRAATVNEIAEGRLVLGVGAGWNRVEFDAFGFPFEDRVPRFVESFEIVRRLLAGERLDHDGRFHRLIDCELIPPPRPTRLLIGSNGPRMLAVTFPHVDGWNTWFEDFDNDPARLSPLLERIASAEAAAGRTAGSIERTVALLFQFGDVSSRRNSSNPIQGPPQAMAEKLAELAGLGIGHVQLVLDPITEDSIARAAEVTDLFRSFL